MQIFFDECTSPHIAQALNILESRKKEIEVIHTKGILGQGAPDTDIVPYVSDRKGVLFSQDDDFFKAQEVVEAMSQYPIGFFYFKQPKKASYWDYVRVYTRIWLDAREKILSMNPPYYFQIMSGGKIKQFNL